MKLETSIVILKGLCFALVGFFTPASTALAQYANTGEWPTHIVWVVIFISCCTSGATALLSYLSGSFSDYMAKRATPSGGTQFLTNTATKP